MNNATIRVANIPPIQKRSRMLSIQRPCACLVKSAKPPPDVAATLVVTLSAERPHEDGGHPETDTVQ